MLRDEAVTEGARALVREDACFPLPTLPVDGVERVDVDIAAVPVLGSSLRRRAESIHRLAEVREAPEDPLPFVVVCPVRVSLALGELARPVRDVQLDVRLLREPGIETEVRQTTLPGLNRPVRPVRRLALGDEQREPRAVVGSAAIPEALPVPRLPVLTPSACVVE